MTSRYVLAALARPRAEWLDRVVQLANSGAVAADLHKCVGLVDLLAHLGPARRTSAALLDAGVHGVDRDLIHRAHTAGIAVVIIADAHARHDWSALDADAVLSQDFSPHELLDTLISVARMVHDAEFDYALVTPPLTEASPWDGSLVAVTGSGGTGVSTVAIAASQGLGQTDGARQHRTALVDFRLSAEQAMLHDVDPTSPGLLELIDLCRLGAPEVDRVRSLSTAIPDRSYDLLPGLRRRRLWTQLRPASTLQAIHSLLRTYDNVVADLDGDVEGEPENGSIDVEERNQLTRLALQHASVVVVVGHSSMKGLHSLARQLREVIDLGVAPACVQPVFNYAAPGSRARSGYTAALAELTEGLGITCSPVFVPTRDIDDRVRALVGFPNAIVEPVRGAVAAHLAASWRSRGSDRLADGSGHERRVEAGFLGRWRAAS